MATTAAAASASTAATLVPSATTTRTTRLSSRHFSSSHNDDTNSFYKRSHPSLNSAAEAALEEHEYGDAAVAAADDQERTRRRMVEIPPDNNTEYAMMGMSSSLSSPFKSSYDDNDYYFAASSSQQLPIGGGEGAGEGGIDTDDHDDNNNNTLGLSLQQFRQRRRDMEDPSAAAAAPPQEGEGEEISQQVEPYHHHHHHHRPHHRPSLQAPQQQQRQQQPEDEPQQQHAYYYPSNSSAAAAAANNNNCSSAGSVRSVNATNNLVRAMELSQQAGFYLKQDLYDTALQFYARALQLYHFVKDDSTLASATAVPLALLLAPAAGDEATTMDTTSSHNNNNTNDGLLFAEASSTTITARATNVICMCNAAGCLRNMGSIHKRTKRYEEALSCWNKALDFYKQSRHFVMAALEEQQQRQEQLQLQQQQQQSLSALALTVAGAGATPPSSAPPSPVSSRYSRSSSHNNNNNRSEFVCLDAYIVETLQSRGNLFLKRHASKYHQRPQQQQQQQQHQNYIDQAIACHEEAVDLLLELDRRNEEENNHDDNDAAAGAAGVGGESLENNNNNGFWTVDMSGVVFCAMEKERLIEHLTLSLESLGNLYKTTGSYQDAISVWEEALGMLRRRYEQQQQQQQQQQSSLPTWTTATLTSSNTKQRMVQILRNLSELYMDRNQLELAIAPLNEAMDLLHVHQDDDDDDDSDDDASAAELLCLAMDRLGQAYEQEQQQSPQHQQQRRRQGEESQQQEQGNYEMALACFEKALFARNRYLGEDHIDVAKSLVDVGRVMEKQGNTEGSLDLYRAAQAIYAKQVTSDHYMVANEDVGTILQLIPSLFEQGRFEEAVAYLNKCLEADEVDDHHYHRHGQESSSTSSSKGGVDSKAHATPLDRTQIYFDLGRAYMGMGDYVSATVCLVECAKQLSGDEASKNETRAKICAMLERVEQLQREERSSHRSIHSDDYSYDSEHTAGYDEDDEDSGGENVDETSLASGDQASGEESSQSSGAQTPSRRRQQHRQQQQHKNADNATSATTSPVTSVERAASLTPVTADFSKSASRSEHNSRGGDGDSDNNNNHSISSPEAEGDEGDQYEQLHHATSLNESSFQAETSVASAVGQQNGGIGSTSARGLQTTDGSPQQNLQREPRHHHHEAHRGSNNNNNSSNNMEPSDLSTSILSADVLSSSLLNSSFPEHDLPMNGTVSHPTPSPAASGGPSQGRTAAHNAGNLQSPSRSAIVAVARQRMLPEALASTPALIDAATDDDTETASLLRPEGDKRFGFGLRLNLHTPRKKKGQALENLAVSISGHHHQAKASTTSASSKRPANPFGRRVRRAGFESLSDDNKLPAEQNPHVANSSSVLPSPVLQRDEEYHLLDDNSFDGPIRHVEVINGTADDAISQVTLVLDDRTEKSVGRSNEWWWGVTAEGFGRWFPSSFVSQAVEVADGFLSAKAIHAKVKSAPLDVPSDDESTGDVGREASSIALTGDHASRSRHQGESLAVASTTTMKERQRQPRIHTSFSEEGPLLNDRNLDHLLNVSSPHSRRRNEIEIQSELIQCGQTIAKMRTTLGTTDPQVGASLFRLAVLHSRVRNISAAIAAGSEALQIQKANGNLEHAARSSHLVAELYLHEKQYKPALTHYADALRMEHSVYGRYSENCAKTLNCIGMVRSLCNEFQLAMDAHKEALTVLKECHGDNLEGNPLVSQTLCQIGAVYYRERNSLSTIKSKKDDYTTFIEAGMLEVIGRAHEERGSYKMAIAFFEEKLQFSEIHKHEDSKSVVSMIATEELATTLNSLGMLSSRAGLFMEAIDYYDRALQVQNKIGFDPVYAATSQVLTATVQNQLGHWVKALKLLEEALVVLKRELGTEHETVAATLYHIGVVQASLCNFDIAMAVLKEAYNIQKVLLGKDHPAALRTRREIGNIMVFFNLEQLDTAFEYFTDVLAAQHRIHGFKHPNIAETLHSIGCAYVRKGDHTTALKTLEECYYMRLEFLGVDHPLQATTLHEIAKIHICRGRYKKATIICDTVLDIRKESLSESHIDYARALGTKGHSLTLRGDVNSAMACLNEALHIAKQAVITTYPVTAHPSVAEIDVHIATLHLRNCQFADAKAAAQSAIEILNQSGKVQQRQQQQQQQQHYQHPALQEAIDLLERIKRDEMLCV